MKGNENVRHAMKLIGGQFQRWFDGGSEKQNKTNKQFFNNKIYWNKKKYQFDW